MNKCERCGRAAGLFGREMTKFRGGITAYICCPCKNEADKFVRNHPLFTKLREVEAKRYVMDARYSCGERPTPTVEEVVEVMKEEDDVFAVFNPDLVEFLKGEKNVDIKGS